MRFGFWRGTPLALALTTAIGLAAAITARADDLGLHTIPRSVAAYDYTTGQQYRALPIPYGHYAKDPLGSLSGKFGCIGCGLGGGNGLFHNGNGMGNGSGCDTCDDGSGHKWFGKNYGLNCPGGKGCSLFGKHARLCGPTCASAQAPTPQAAHPSAQSACGAPGCKIMGKHGHGGLFNGLCGKCGGMGCNDCGGMPGTGCGLCGGRGCGACLSNMMGGLKGKLAGLLHHNKVKYFLGAGGPVPLTPGYVPYIVTTRSPREFFAFPPMNPNVP